MSMCRYCYTITMHYASEDQASIWVESVYGFLNGRPNLKPYWLRNWKFPFWNRKRFAKRGVTTSFNWFLCINWELYFHDQNVQEHNIYIFTIQLQVDSFLEISTALLCASFFINLAKQGYCNHFVCLFICLSVFCVSAMLLNTIHGTLHGTLWCYIMKHSCILFWGKAGVSCGEVRWGRVVPNKPIVPIFNHFEPHKTTFSRTKPLLST